MICTLLVVVLFEVITNIKMFSLKDLVKFASASGDEKIVVFPPKVSNHAHAKFISRSKVLQKMESNLVG